VTNGRDRDRADDLEQFAQYRAHGDRALRDELVSRYRDLAYAIAHRFRGRGEPIEDLEQVALVGLVKAVDRFDPERGFAFPTFATPTISGELKRHFRDQWTVRVPRAVQETVLDLNAAVADLSQALHRSPTVAEVARRVGRSEEAVLEAMEAGRAFRAVGIDAPSGAGAGPTPADRLAVPEPGIADVEQQMTVEVLLDRLAPREREIIRLRFFEGLTQSEIAARVGISQMHVSRLIARSLEQLRGSADLEPGDLDSD
jgi:RNA polymerase sigma-B factor